MKRAPIFCCKLVVVSIGFFLLSFAASDHVPSDFDVVRQGKQRQESPSSGEPTEDIRSGRRGLLDRYRESVLQAGSPRKATLFDPLSYHFGGDPNDIDADFDPNFLPETISGKDRARKKSDSTASSDAPDSSASSDENQQQKQQQKLPHTPVIYRYYGKSRSRTRASGSIPFILLGPNVDHWRTTGEHLAARGFSVIACERDPLEDEEAIDTARKTERIDGWWKGEDGEGANMISNVLQASRWTKAILVACDSEAVLAIQATFGLAPDKIAGLVLVGDLQEVDSLLQESHSSLCQQESSFAVDAFLHQILPCPFAIAWDGEVTASDKQPMATPSRYDGSSPAECLQGNRCFILGGGVAPHRRQPETFAWTLTRFVEDKVAPSIPMAEKRKLFGRLAAKGPVGGGDNVPRLPKTSKGLGRFISGDYFSTGSLVVYGRIVASALLYASMLKVGIYQYAKFLDGMVNMKTRYDVLQSVKRKTFGIISGFFHNYGYIPLLFRKKEEHPEMDPVDFVTELEPDPKFEHTDVTREEPGVCEEDEADEKAGPSGDEDKEEESDGTESVDETEDGSGPSEDSQPEKEERNRFQPLFFLDRVVASLDSTRKNAHQAKWPC